LLRGSKLVGYNIFKTVALMIKEKTKKKLTLEGLIQILNLSYFMNCCLGLGLLKSKGKETSLRTDESKEILVNKLIEKYVELPTVLDIVLANNITNNKEPLVHFVYSYLNLNLNICFYKCKSKNKNEMKSKCGLLNCCLGLLKSKGSGEANVNTRIC
jgi:hypothetical protein